MINEDTHRYETGTAQLHETWGDGSETWTLVWSVTDRESAVGMIRKRYSELHLEWLGKQLMKGCRVVVGKRYFRAVERTEGECKTCGDTRRVIRLFTANGPFSDPTSSDDPCPKCNTNGRAGRRTFSNQLEPIAEEVAA